MDSSVESYPATGSLLAPALITFHASDDPRDLVKVVLSAAGQAVPPTKSQRGIVLQGKRQGEAVQHSRTILFGKDKDGRHLARLCDKRGNENPSESFPHWRWEVTIGTVDERPDIFEPTPVGQHLSWQVTKCILSGGSLDSAPQLALFRHLVIEGLQALDPDLQVHGGPSGWSGEWWPESET